MLKPVVFSDAGFNTNIDHTSQIGYILAIVDENNKANVIAYASKKGRTATHSVFASELLALMEAFDRGAALKRQLFEILDIFFCLVVHCGQQDSLYRYRSNGSSDRETSSCGCSSAT
jgi:hypothetical protein